MISLIGDIFDMWGESCGRPILHVKQIYSSKDNVGSVDGKIGYRIFRSVLRGAVFENR